MVITFDRLQANLSEIEASLRRCDVSKLHASSDGSLYDPNSMTGQIKKVWDQAKQWFWEENHPTSLNDTLIETLTPLFNQAVEQAYLARQKRIIHHLSLLNRALKQTITPQWYRYKAFIAEELDLTQKDISSTFRETFRNLIDNGLNHQELASLQQTISHFHRATASFWKIPFSTGPETDNLSLLIRSLSSTESSSYLTNAHLFHALKKERRWAKIECILEQPIPLLALVKLGHAKGLEASDKEALKNWVHALNQHGKALSPHLLACLLDEIVQIAKIQGTANLTFATLVHALAKEGCLLLHVEDSHHLRWRESLKPGDFLTCNGKVLKLGRKISHPKEGPDTFLIFETPLNSRCVVKVANNRFRLLLDDQQKDDETAHWAIEAAKERSLIAKNSKKSEDWMPMVTALSSRS